MPIYEYQCFACDHTFEETQKMAEDPISVCPSCGDTEQVRRLVSASSFHLKGSGWYKTDYGSSGSAGTASSSKPEKEASASSDKSSSSSSDSSSGSSSGSTSSTSSDS